MIPISLSWDTRKRSVLLKWNRLISSGWQDGKILIKVLGLSIFRPLEKKSIRLVATVPMRWIYLREMFSFFPKWKLKKMEGTLSFPDPMVNGVLYGWMSALQAGKADRKNRVTVNFLGENWCAGEMTLSLKIFFQYLRSWIFLLIRERRGRKVREGGDA